MIKTTICREPLKITQNYKWNHRAIDLAPLIPQSGKGPIIYAHTAGRWDYFPNYPVKWKGKTYPTNYGRLSTPDGRVYKHWHLHSNIAKNGSNLNAGKRLAYMGSTGYSTGTHTHFEKWVRTLGIWRPVNGLADITKPAMPPCEDRLRRCRKTTKELEVEIKKLKRNLKKQTAYHLVWAEKAKKCFEEKDKLKKELEECKESKGILVPLNSEIN